MHAKYCSRIYFLNCGLVGILGISSSVRYYIFKTSFVRKNKISLSTILNYFVQCTKRTFSCYARIQACFCSFHAGHNSVKLVRATEMSHVSNCPNLKKRSRVACENIHKFFDFPVKNIIYLVQKYRNVYISKIHVKKRASATRFKKKNWITSKRVSLFTFQIMKIVNKMSKSVNLSGLFLQFLFILSF